MILSVKQISNVWYGTQSDTKLRYLYLSYIINMLLNLLIIFLLNISYISNLLFFIEY